MGWLKNIIRSWMLREKLDTMAEVRLQNYKVVALKFIELDAGGSGHGDLIPEAFIAGKSSQYPHMEQAVHTKKFPEELV